MRQLLVIPLALSRLLTSVSAQFPPRSSIDATGTSFLDHDALVSPYWGQNWLKDNIPFIDIPDKTIQDVYYYRFTALMRHLYYTIQGTGYIITEFIQPVGYAQAFGSIDAAAGHQIEEARWLRDFHYAHDYVQLYTRGPGNSSQYTQWILHAAAGTTNVTGELGFIESQLPGMIRMWQEWDYTFDSDAGLYYFKPVWDAQEYSLPGYVATNGSHTLLEHDGPDTFRPSLNAYMVANAHAIADTASMMGNTTLASEYRDHANNVEMAMYRHLWDPAQQFFTDVIRPNNPNLTKLQGRQEVGYYPYRFGIGLTEKYSASAMQQLLDPEGFMSEYGPTTLEQRNEYFTDRKPPFGCCFWQGQSWPFSTAHTLKAFADVVRSGSAPGITAEHYYQYMNTYARTQHKDGVPYVAEEHSPVRDLWTQDAFNHSEHYQHSTNCDNVITGLLGFIPRADGLVEVSPLIPSDWTFFALENVPYHGHLITVLYDASGSRYQQGRGLIIFCDGAKIYSGNGTKAIARLPPNNAQQANASAPAPIPPKVNIAANPLGAAGWPQASATYTNESDDPFKAIDGVLFYDYEPDNRWTNDQQPGEKNASLTIQLPRKHNLTGVAMAIYVDANRSPPGHIACPISIEIADYRYPGNAPIAYIFDFLPQCIPNDINVITFDETWETDAISINLERQQDYFVGLAEVQLWVPANTGPFYYAVDALPTMNTNVTFDNNSSATSTGGVLAPYSNGSVIDFSGVYSAHGGRSQMWLHYKNNGSSSVSVGLEVNRQASSNMTLESDNGYQTFAMDVELWQGTNFIRLYGGGDGVYVEGMSVYPVMSK